MGKVKLAIGTGVAALMATGAALFFVKTTPGKKTAKKIKAEAVELGKKAAAKLQDLKLISKDKYEEVVEQLVNDYVKSKKIAKAQAAGLKKDLKGHWREIKKEIKKKPAKSKK